MKTLIVYYSRSNVTRRVAEDIQKGLNCDIAEITEIESHKGSVGYLKGAIEALRHKDVEINGGVDPSDYDLVVVGTPVWASNIASPVHTYLNENRDKFNNLAYFCTCDGTGHNKTLNKMAELTGKEAVATFYTTKSILKNDYEDKMFIFVDELRKAS